MLCLVEFDPFVGHLLLFYLFFGTNGKSEHFDFLDIVDHIIDDFGSRCCFDFVVLWIG